ncbi:peroxisome biogenesis factor 6 isoform X1 [Dendrobates tinctorius]|uniref:peroxisome biogenesis factor 6 isoform X1 n=1 Tax=Dendrobates tinctorius TaxID=92724 RepID=UPI003CCA40CD
MADSRCSGGCLLFFRTRGPLTPRRLLLSSPPTLDWGLLGVQSRRTPTPGGPVLVRRGEALPDSGALVLDTRPTLQGFLGPDTRFSRIEVKKDSAGREGGPPTVQPEAGRGPSVLEPEAGRGPSVLEPEAGRGPSVLEPEAGRGPSVLEPEAGRGPSVLEPEAGRGPSVLEPEAGRGPSVLEPEAGRGPSVLEPEAGSGPSVLEPEAGSGPSVLEPEAGRGPSVLEPEAGRGPSVLEPEAGRGPSVLEPEAGRGPSVMQPEAGSGPSVMQAEAGRGPPLNRREEEQGPLVAQMEVGRQPCVRPMAAPSSGDCSVSFLDASVGASDLFSPLVSSFARTSLPVRLRVAPIDAEPLVRAGRLQEVGGPVDRGSALWVSKKQLRVLGLYHREWVWVSVPAQGNGRRHLAMIVAAELWLGHPHKYNHLLSSACLAARDEVAGIAVISATLAFNLSKGTGAVTEVLIQRFNTEPTQEGRSALVEPPLASLLHLSVVKSPAYNSEAIFQEALCQHFQTPRAVQVGDVLCVSCFSHSDFEFKKSQMPVRFPDLYFKVQKIDGEHGSDGYVADRIHSTLYQVGSVCSSVPSFPSHDGHVFWSSMFPAGLSHSVDDVCRILLPHLQRTSDVLGEGGRVLLTGPKGSGKTTVVRATCSRLNLHLYQVECARLCRDSSASSIARLHSVFSNAQDCGACVLLLCHLDLLGKDRDGSGEDTRVISALCSLLHGKSHSNLELPFLVVATTSRAQEVPLDLQSCFLHEVCLNVPTEEQRLSLLTVLTAPLPLSRDVDLAHLASSTVGFVVGDLCALLSRAGRISCARIRSSCVLSEEEEDGLLAAGFPVNSQDLDRALAELQEAHSKAIGAPKVPCVHWADVGGLEDAKRQLLDTVQFPLEHPKMLSLGLSRSGILLYGPPGTGKTLLAKAVATECAMTFLSVKGPELINMYVGQSEENVRDIFSRAEAASPCIIFFDELDSLAPNRGRSGDSGGVMDRVVSQLLAEMDGLHSSSDVFVIGATNRPDLLDPALLRPGRFDKLVYVGLNDNRNSQLKVLEAITRRFSLDPAVDLAHVLQSCPAALTGADLYALCADAMMSAIKDQIRHLQEGAGDGAAVLVLRLEHLMQAAERLQSSVSQKELQRYERIHRHFSMSAGV